MLKIVILLIDFLISIYKSETDARGKEVEFLKARNKQFESDLAYQQEKTTALQQQIDIAHKNLVTLEQEYSSTLELARAVSRDKYKSISENKRYLDSITDPEVLRGKL